MMKIKFSKFERVAGAFVGIAMLGFLFSMIGIAVKQGWFEQKATFVTEFENADGVHAGTGVVMSGIKAGVVDEVELTSENRILIHFSVQGKFIEKVRQDSVSSLVRPFVIGERQLEVSVGHAQSPALAENARVRSEESVDLMTVLSGRRLGQYLSSMGSMMDNLKKLVEAFADGSRTDALIATFDKIEPLVKNLNTMSIEVIKLSKQANKDEKFGVVLDQIAMTTKEINAFLPAFSGTAPQLAKDMTSLVSNMSELTREFKVVIPALAAVAPDLPRASRRAIEALDEAVVLLKSMERSFFLRGHAEDIRQEEAKEQAKQRAKEEAEAKRAPASK